MATSRGVARTLAILHELYPTREVTEPTLHAWLHAFPDLADDELYRCAMLAAKEPGRKFFPGPGDIMAHLPRMPIDAERALRQVEKLAIYAPNVGMIYPRPGKVREKLGDIVADAYMVAGAESCFADDGPNGNSVTREIARRDFAKELTAAASRQSGLPLPAGVQRTLPSATRDK